MLENLIHLVFYQIIQVNQTDPCFLNETAGINILRNCGLGTDYLQTIFLPWEWITGGYFTMILVAIFTIMTYIKYHKVVYPLLIGTLFLPISYFAFPDEFINYAFIFAIAAIAFIIGHIILKQTKEY